MTTKGFALFRALMLYLGFYLIKFSSLQIAAPCGTAWNLIAALMVMIGINRSCYLLRDFYRWYSGADEKNKD